MSTYYSQIIMLYLLNLDVWLLGSVDGNGAVWLVNASSGGRRSEARPECADDPLDPTTITSCIYSKTTYSRITRP